MAHPIFQANETSPYGDLSREEFYKKHHIIHKEGFVLNEKEKKIFTQSWQHDSCDEPRGVVCMIHGYTSESSWIFELNAVAMAKAGLFVFAIDLPGHGLPAFLYGESLGGAIAILVCLEQKHVWNGLILSGPMCGVSKKYKPVWPLEEFLPLAAFFAPNWRIIFTKPPSRKSCREALKKKLVAKSPNRFANERPPAATGLELLKVCKYIQNNCHELEVPLLILQGGDDKVCDPNAVKAVFKSAGSKDKTLKIFAGMWHQLIGEPNESVELVFNTTLSWIQMRANLARAQKL
nr:caffeoylshikimate esterase-like [Ipomoea batatas]